MKWEEIIKKYPEANFLQSPNSKKMNTILGDKVVEITTKNGFALGAVRNAKRGRYLEIPCGPLVDFRNKKALKEIFGKIREAAKEEKCVFVRVRPQLLNSPKNLAILNDLGLKKSPMHLAAEHTVMIDLRKSEEELLSSMRRQTRYEVRRADKLGIKVTRDNSEKIFEEFHKMQVKTARRQGFVPPSLKALLAEREAFGDKIWIYKAELDGDAVAYGLIISDGLEGDYYEAASTELNQKIPGAYAIIWRVARDLKAAGYERFNLWGIAPAGQLKHRYAGVTTFKTGFGGEIVDYVPAHDMIISKIGYLKDLVTEKARKKWRHL